MKVTKYLTHMKNQWTDISKDSDIVKSVYVPVLCEIGAHSNVTFPSLYFGWLQYN